MNSPRNWFADISKNWNTANNTCFTIPRHLNDIMPCVVLHCYASYQLSYVTLRERRTAYETTHNSEKRSWYFLSKVIVYGRITLPHICILSSQVICMLCVVPYAVTKCRTSLSVSLCVVRHTTLNIAQSRSVLKRLFIIFWVRS